MELKRFCLSLWKHRAGMAAMFVVIVLLTAFVTFTMKPVYQASSTLLFEHKNAPLDGLSQGRTADDALKTVTQGGNPLDTQASLLRSAPIVQKVVESQGLTDPETGLALSPTKFLASAQVLPIKGTDLLQLTYRAHDPAEAKRIVDAWAQAFVEESRAANRVDASQAVKFISSQMEKNRHDLAEAEMALRNFKRANGAVDLSEEARSSVQTLSSIDAELRQTTSAYQEASARVAALRRQVGLSSSQALAASALSQDPTIQRLRQQLLAVETDLSNVTMGPEHPEVKRMKAQVSLLQGKLAEQSRALIGRQYSQQNPRMELDPVRQALARDLIQAEGDALAYQTRLTTLRSLSGNFNHRLTALPDKELQLTRLERSASVASELNRMLLQRYEEARIHAAMNTSYVRVAEEALPPEAPLMPQKVPYMLAGMTVGLAMAIVLAMLLEYLDETIQNVDDAEEAVKLPTLGVIPWMRSSKEAQLIAASDSKAPASEAYRTLRTNLKFLKADGPLKTLAFTSAGAHEGKSTTSANIAVSFAQAGHRVLLVDADMRRPRIHQLFGLNNMKGLSVVLQGKRTVDESIHREVKPHLDVLTAGLAPDTPAELLESPAMTALLAEFAQRYDLVIFDAPPVIAVTDVSVLASRLDGVVLVVGANQATYRAATHAVKLLQAAKAVVLGIVVRGIRPSNDPYYNSYYHRYVSENTDDRSRKRKAS